MLSALTTPLSDSSAERDQHDIVLHMSMYLMTDQWNNTVSHNNCYRKVCGSGQL